MTNSKEEEAIQVEYDNYVYSENDRVVKKNYQIGCAFVVNLMMTSYGLIVPASGFLIPQLEDPDIGFGISLDEGSWLASIMVLGSLTGSFCGGIATSKFGRKKSLLIDSFLYVIATLIMAIAPNFYLVLLGRLIHGHSAASAMVSIPIYTSEISQPQVRKITGSFTLMCYATGFALALVLGALLPWRWAVGSVLICPFCCFFLLLLCPESPVWYLTKGQDDLAKQSLIKLRGEDNMDIVEAEFNRINLNLKIMEKEEEINAGQEQEGKVKQIFSIMTDVTFLKPFSILLVLFAVALEWTGLPAIGFYMVPLLKKSKVPIDPFWAAAMLASYRALIAIVAASMIGRCQRRPLWFACCSVMIVGLISLSGYTYFNQTELLTDNFPFARWIPIFSIMVVYTAFSFGFGSIPYMLQGELLPSHARSFGSGLLGFLDNLSLFISTKMVPTFNELLGVHGAFLMYACICGAVVIVSFFCMPETSGMSLEEIEDMYRPKNKKKMSQPSQTS